MKQTFNLEAKDGDERSTRDGFLKYYDEIIFNEARKWVIATHQVRLLLDDYPSLSDFRACFGLLHIFKIPDRWLSALYREKSVVCCSK